MSDSVRPHRRQPTRLPRSWDSPGKNTGVGYHFLLQCIKVKSESEVAQPCRTPGDPMDCSPPGSSTHGIFQARVLEWGAIAFSKTVIGPTQFNRPPLISPYSIQQNTTHLHQILLQSRRNPGPCTGSDHLLNFIRSQSISPKLNVLIGVQS